MVAAADLDEIEEVNANCILMANLQQALSLGTQTDSTPVYDTDGSAEVHENYDDNEIFNMFIQEEQYTELLEPIPKPQQVPHNDNNVISEVTDVEQDGETVEQHSVNFEETRALYESLYQNLAVEVEKVNSVNCKLKETNEDLTTELARNQVIQNVVQNPRVQNIGNQNGNGNLVATRDRSAEVYDYENYDANEIFNMFTQEEQYTELLEPIPDQHQVPHNDNKVISEVTSVEQSGKQ
nr:hypothetical protein [Tanacetum cinerariifolium]